MIARYLLPLVLLSSMAFGQSSWLQFNAGASENSSPLVQFNGKWDSFLTFDIELRGLLAETVTVDSQDYLRFSTSPGTVPADSVGYPELPVVRRLVWIPDDSDITLDYSANCCEGIECLPVYPAPFDSLVSDSTCTPYIGEFFRKDSAAYASTEWYPEVQAELVGEFRLRDLRVGIVDVYPVQYLASEDSLRVWSDIEIALSYDITASWPTCNLGCYEGLVGDGLLGYKPEPPPWAPVPGRVSRPGNLEAGPGFVPDYVILVASGLDGWWVDTLAHHRADLDGFDVAIARTDSVLSQFSQAQAITPDIIRDFTEAMWDWGSAETKRPSYLLLIGDHEDVEYAQEPWFLPTHTALQTSPCWFWANDSWYVLFDEDPSALSAPPDMIVGRLPARDPDNLHAMVDLIIDFESEATSWPPPSGLSWRRWLTRLSGQNNNGSYVPYDPWEPTTAWAGAFADWLGYQYDNLNCGDGDDESDRDGSTVTAHQWVDTLTNWFERGQQVAFYANHGETHMFSAGVQWLPDLPDSTVPNHMGIPDSVFDSFDAKDLGENALQHAHPFVISLCCLTGTFNHTVEQHEYTNPGHYVYSFHFNDDSLHPPVYDYGTDCMAEAWVKNTEGGAIGVFASSEVSYTSYYGPVGENLIRSIYCQGNSRLGDAIASMRFTMMADYYAGSTWSPELGRFNLLGDPAVDIGDRVKFRDRCDLVISPDDILISRYPTRSVSGSNASTQLQANVRNNGAAESGEFDATLRVTSGNNYDTTLTTTCEGLDPGEQDRLVFDWTVPRTFHPPVEVTLHATADPDEDCDDSWTANNDASLTFELEDFYPNQEGWPIGVPGSIISPPVLADLDGDEDLEIIVITGRLLLSAYDPDSPGEPTWTVGPFGFGPLNGNGCSVPLAADILGSSSPEIIVDAAEALLVISGATGDILCSYEHADPTGLLSARPHTPIVADVISDNNTKEVALLTASGTGATRHVSLLILEASGSSLVLADSLPLPESGVSYLGGWLCSENLLSDSYDEILVSYTWATAGPNRQSGLWICDYNPRSSVCYFADSLKWASETISRYPIPAVGELAGNMRIAMSRQRNSSDFSPAYIFDTALAMQDTCAQNGNLVSNQVLCCVMADWVIGLGLDRIISPADNQVFAWDNQGNPATHWPRTFTSADNYRPPFPALGDLGGEDESAFADLLVSTRSGWIQAYDADGSPLEDLGFPYQLPSEVKGGFCVADIDGDSKVEVVFGTMDNYLHVWELGSCSEYYAPWPQCQHDAARTGVLE